MKRILSQLMSLSGIMRFAKRFAWSGPRPERDWVVLLCIAGTLLLGIIGWSVWAFTTVVKGGTLGAEQPAATAPVQTSALDTIGARLDERAAEDAKYVNGAYRFTDPSQ